MVEMKPLDQCQLYAFVDASYLGSSSPESVTEELCEGGADLVQFRAKNLSQEEILQIARRLLPITERAGVGLVINDYPQIALRLGAQACHLGQEDFFGGGDAHCSALLPPKSDLKIGLSSHRPEQAIRCVASGADYVAVGPVFPTRTKPLAAPVTLEYVRWAARHLSLPWFAIGGITLENLDDVVKAGARRICVVSAILRSPDIVMACRSFKDRLLSGARANKPSKTTTG